VTGQARGLGRHSDRYSGKVAIVTGAGSGMGRETCLALGAAGARVLAADINEQAATATANDIVQEGGQAYAQTVDVADSKQVNALVDTALQHWHTLDFMFNIAGRHIAGDYHEFSIEVWQRLMGTNFWGVIHGTNAAYDVMRKQGHGHIVNMGSLSGIMPTPMQIPYAVSKAAVVELSTSLREEAKSFGVRVTVVCPGAVGTQLFAHGDFLNAKDPDYMHRLSRFMYSAKKSARRILIGVARNKPMILFPAHAKFLYGLYRIHHSLTVPYSAIVRYSVGRNRLPK
jgi:NAD(P)-dependent dehydrogenase (short-subunit alcohol dehydrogenase family)